MRTCRGGPNDKTRLAPWLIALASVAATAAIYRWAPSWVPEMRVVSVAAAVITIIGLWTPAGKRWLARKCDGAPR
jgi:hypothetical protein